METQLCLACSVNPATSSNGTVPLCSSCAAQASGKERGVEFRSADSEEEASED